MAPFVHRVSPDGQHIVVRIVAFTKASPADFDERRTRFQIGAVMTVGTVSSYFGIKDSEQANRDIQVEFVDYMAKPGEETVVAEYTNGKLTIH
jgi:hypothetical protein